MKLLRRILGPALVAGGFLLAQAGLALAPLPAQAQLATLGAGKGVVGGGGGGFTPTVIGLNDNFNDASQDTAKWNATTNLPPWLFNTIGGSRVEGSGVVSITPTVSTDTTQGYSSVNTYDLTAGRAAYVHLVTAPTNNETTFGFWIGGGEWIRFVVDKQFGASTIAAYKQNFGNSEFLWGSGGSVNYDATNHACLLINYNGAAFEAYTGTFSAGNCGNWTLRGTSALSNFAVTALRVGFFSSANNASPGTAVWDGFNTAD